MSPSSARVRDTWTVSSRAPDQTLAPASRLLYLAFVCGAVAVVFLPLVFGAIGIAAGAVVRSRGEKRGTTAMWESGVGMALGVLLVLSR